MRKFFLALCVFSALLAAQPREFLTDSEVDQVREAQEPNDRMKLYVQFARARLDTIEKELTKAVSDERAARIHDCLYEYGKILDAIDDFSDEAPKQRIAMRKGVAFVVHAEPEFLKRLQAIDEKNPPDREQYHHALSDAIESTEASIEEYKKVLGKLPTDKKLEKEIEAEQKQDEQERAKKKPNQPNQQQPPPPPNRP